MPHTTKAWKASHGKVNHWVGGTVIVVVAVIAMSGLALPDWLTFGLLAACVVVVVAMLLTLARLSQHEPPGGATPSAA